MKRNQIRFCWFPSANTFLGAPDGWDAEKYGTCYTLPVYYDDGVSVSCWKPNLRQRLALLFGRPIFLHIVGRQQPTAMSVE